LYYKVENDTQIYVVFNTKFNKMEENKNLEQNLDKSNEKLHISDVIDSDFFYNELKRCIDDSYERDLDEKDFTLNEYKLIEEIKHVIKNHFL
jgi:hypothetical protein